MEMFVKRSGGAPGIGHATAVGSRSRLPMIIGLLIFRQRLKLFSLDQHIVQSRKEVY